MRHIALLCGLVATASPVRAEDFDRAVGGYFARHCLSCHGPKAPKGDFRIDTLSKNVGTKDTPQWAEIVARITAGEMPPPEVKDRPTAEQNAAVVEWLSARLKEGEAARMAARGPVAYYRLSREEYVNTVYDLLGVRFDAADPGGLTEDPEWHGFERLGSVLTLSPSHIEKYLHAGETIVRVYPGGWPVIALPKEEELFGRQ